MIIRGINEIKSTSIEVRRNHDVNEVNEVIKMADPHCKPPVKTIRLGKYDPTTSRPIKAIFSTSETAKSILRNKHHIKPDTIKIYSDETTYQQKFRQNLRDELKRRTELGEKDLTIKYVNGIPKIIKMQPKN